MVSYQRWTALVFEAHPEANAQDVISAAAAEWREKKSALEAATVREAREHAETL